MEGVMAVWIEREGGGVYIVSIYLWGWVIRRYV